MKEIYEKLPGAVLPWYRAGHRDLPWRQDTQPYHVWLSEIMLQQTRVEAVKGYYARFLEALPTVSHLARCPDDLLHKLWEGLGYYSRVRNLKKAAVEILERYDGVFPGEYGAVRALPGIGDYTAGAICSICFSLPTPAVDGNVMRLISRLTDDHTPIDSNTYRQQVRRELEQIYPREAGDFTQGLMELGATLCGPNRKPDCENCPCRDFCLGHRRGTAESLPVKNPKAARRTEQRTVLMLRAGDRWALRKRPDTGLLAGLWQFPDTQGKLEPQQALDLAAQWGLKPRHIIRQLERSHIFTHIRWDMTGYYLEVESAAGDFRWCTPEEIRREAALPTAYRQFWEARQE